MLDKCYQVLPMLGCPVDVSGTSETEVSELGGACAGFIGEPLVGFTMIEIGVLEVATQCTVAAQPILLVWAIM